MMAGVVKVNISRNENVLPIIWRPWVQKPVGSNLQCVVLLFKSYLNQNWWLQIRIHSKTWSQCAQNGCSGLK